MNYSLQQIHDIHLKAAKQFIVNLRDDTNASDYIQSRNINLAWAIDNGIGYAKDDWNAFHSTLTQEERRIAKACGLVGYSEKTNRHYDVFRNRIMFPILNNDGFIVGMGGRDISGEQEAKYLNTKETPWFQKHQVLYNLHRCQSSHQSSIVVVEGYMDVIAARHGGIDNLTAVMGTAFSEEHANACIERNINAVTFCYDGDKAGVVAAKKSLGAAGILVANGIDVKYVFLPEGLDPDDAINTHGADHFNSLIQAGVTPEKFIAQYMINMTAPGESIDLSLQAVSSALTECDGANLDVGATWKHLLELLPHSVRDVCQNYAAHAFNQISNEELGLNSIRNADYETKNFLPT